MRQVIFYLVFHKSGLIFSFRVMFYQTFLLKESESRCFWLIFFFNWKTEMHKKSKKKYRNEDDISNFQKNRSPNTCTLQNIFSLQIRLSAYQLIAYAFHDCLSHRWIEKHIRKQMDYSHWNSVSDPNQ